MKILLFGLPEMVEPLTEKGIKVVYDPESADICVADVRYAGIAPRDLPLVIIGSGSLSDLTTGMIRPDAKVVSRKNAVAEILAVAGQISEKAQKKDRNKEDEKPAAVKESTLRTGLINEGRKGFLEAFKGIFRRPKKQTERPAYSFKTGLNNVLGFYSGTKGGVGKTTCAANLAAWLATHGFKVAVIDADTVTRGMTVLAYGIDETAWPAHPSGFFGGAVLYPPRNAGDIPYISRQYDYVLLDFGAQYDSATLELLNACSTLVIITVPEQLAVNIVCRFLNRERRSVKRRLCLVVNRVKPRAEMLPWKIGEILGLPVLAMVPETDEVEKAYKTGKLPVLAYRKGIMAKTMSALWEKLCCKAVTSGTVKSELG